MVRSRRAPLILSCTISRLEQNATVTQHTASCPPAVPSISAASTAKPAGMAAAKESR